MKKRKILIVDDEESFGKIVKRSLEKTGEYSVEVENKGARAFSTVKKIMPDLVLLDIMMPDADGGEVSSLIKADKNCGDIPIVFLTALVTKAEVISNDGMIGGMPYLAKPVSKDQLIECIEEHVRG